MDIACPSHGDYHCPECLHIRYDSLKGAFYFSKDYYIFIEVPFRSWEHDYFDWVPLIDKKNVETMEMLHSSARKIQATWKSYKKLK